MGKGEKKKKTEESKRKRNREAKNEEILEVCVDGSNNA